MGKKSRIIESSLNDPIKPKGKEDLKISKSFWFYLKMKHLFWNAADYNQVSYNLKLATL